MLRLYVKTFSPFKAYWLTRSGSGAGPSPKPQQASAAGIRDGRWLWGQNSVAKLVSGKR